MALNRIQCLSPKLTDKKLKMQSKVRTMAVWVARDINTENASKEVTDLDYPRHMLNVPLHKAFPIMLYIEISRHHWAYYYDVKIFCLNSKFAHQLRGILKRYIREISMASFYERT